MNCSRYVCILIIILLLVGCRQGADEPVPETPTPFSTVGVTMRAPVGEPINISLANLAANPDLYKGSNLRLRGQYQRLPRLICEGRAYPSPASWGLVGDGLLANATVLDQQLRELVNFGQEITVEGRWLQHVGPVGCGKKAPIQEVWYLSTSRVVDPHPLARSGPTITAGPPQLAVDVDQALTATPSTEGAPLEPTATATSLVTATLTATTTPSVTPITPIPASATVPPPISVTLTPSPISTAAVATAVQTGTVTSTPTATGSPSGTGTPTATPTATATATGQEPQDKGQLDFEDLIINELASGEVHAWNVSVSNTDSVTITVAPEATTNIVFSVFNDAGQTLVDRRNQAADGRVETIVDLAVQDTGSIQIQIAADPAEDTSYAIMVLDNESYNFTFMGALNIGAQRGDSLDTDNDHFWFFSATDGDSIDLTVSPSGDADAYVELYGPDSSLLQTIDDEGAGGDERLENYSILASGMYAIRVGEFDFEPMTYQILVEES